MQRRKKEQEKKRNLKGLSVKFSKFKQVPVQAHELKAL